MFVFHGLLLTFARLSVFSVVSDPAAAPVAFFAYPSLARSRLSVGMDRDAGSMARGGIQLGVPGSSGVPRALDSELHLHAWERVGPERHHGRVRWVIGKHGGHSYTGCWYTSCLIDAHSTL